MSMKLKFVRTADWKRMRLYLGYVTLRTVLNIEEKWDQKELTKTELREMKEDR